MPQPAASSLSNSASLLPQNDYDVVVIGSGPGGEGAAMKCAKAGKSVVMVERHAQVGGGCTHWATIPSKALRHAVGAVMEFRRNPLFAALSDNAQFTFPMLLRAAQTVIRKQVTMRRDFYLRNHVPVLHGFAQFISPDTITVTAEDGSQQEIRAKNFIIASGSRPYRPPELDFNEHRIRDSDTILKLDETPDIITIYGAGVVGCEYASIFRNLGVKVNLVHSRDKLLDFLDDEIIDALSYHLRDLGVVLRHNEEHAKVEIQGDGVHLHLKSGKIIKSDVLLWAAGRTGNTSGMNLESLGIPINSRGQLTVDDRYRIPQQPHIYAVGDVVGSPSLASASYDQGRFAGTHVTDPASGLDLGLVQNVPVGIYTSPEISSLGATEKQLTKQGVPYEVGHVPFRNLARAQITGQTVGMLKVLFHRKTLEILGIHCFGDQAAEILHIGQAIMSQKGKANSIEYFVNTTFNYPTMAEAYRVAALNGLNRL